MVLFLLEPGDGFDVIALLDGEDHDFSAFAVDRCTLFSVSTKKVHQWLEDYPEFNRSFLPYLGRKMAALAELATNVVLYDTHVRLAKLILDHALPGNGGRVRLIHDLSHETLAAMIGTVRQVVGRHLQELKKQGAIDVERGHLAIRSLEKLAETADAAAASLRRRS